MHLYTPPTTRAMPSFKNVPPIAGDMRLGCSGSRSDAGSAQGSQVLSEGQVHAPTRSRANGHTLPGNASKQALTMEDFPDSRTSV